MAQERGLEGWVPALGDTLSLAQVIDLAFDYRGDVTIERVDGTEVVGYVYNRSGHAGAPFVQVFEAKGGGGLTIPYSEIGGIRFTGRDTAAGLAYQAWKRRREDG